MFCENSTCESEKTFEKDEQDLHVRKEVKMFREMCRKVILVRVLALKNCLAVASAFSQGVFLSTFLFSLVKLSYGSVFSLEGRSAKFRYKKIRDALRMHLVECLI